MPRFEIQVMESTVHWMTVEAPDLEAATRFAENADMSLFHRSQNPSVWIDDIQEVDGVDDVDFHVDADGNLIHFHLREDA